MRSLPVVDFSELSRSKLSQNLLKTLPKGQTVIVVDDGIATGASVRAALLGLKKKGAKQVVLAVPVAAADSLKSLSKEVDETICLYEPSDFMAVGQFYQKFDQTSDEEVIKLLFIF